MKKESGAIHSYFFGFLLSLVLTLSAYFAVVYRIVPAPYAVAAIFVLAIMQLVVQMTFFLHIDKEKGPRWNLTVFLSTIGVVLIVVVGSLWIMTHLNYHMNMPNDMDEYMLDYEGISK